MPRQELWDDKKAQIEEPEQELRAQLPRHSERGVSTAVKRPADVRYLGLTSKQTFTSAIGGITKKQFRGCLISGGRVCVLNLVLFSYSLGFFTVNN